MTWLNKKDTITFFCYAFVSIVVSCFIYPFVDIKGEKIIDFFSIIIGFLMTAVSLIYASMFYTKPRVKVIQVVGLKH